MAASVASISSGVTRPCLKGDLLQTGDLEALPVLDGGDEVGRFEQRVVSPAVQPGDAPPQSDSPKSPLLHVGPVQIGDLELTPS